MPIYSLTRGSRRGLLLVLPLAAGALLLNVVRGDSSSASDRPRGPVVAAEPRDLATTLEASGNLQRDSETTVAYAGAVASGDDPSPQMLRTPTSTTSSTTSTSSSSTTTSSTTTSTTVAPTTTAPPTTTPSPAAPTTTQPTRPTQPTPDDGGASPDATGPSNGPGQPGSGAPTGGDGGDGGAGGDGGDGGDGGEVPSAILTGVIDVGVKADRGTVLYTADDEPVVSLIGDLPAWRTLEQGIDDGADVEQLEENLVALGYGSGLDVDEAFTADTAEAVEAWETDLGRAEPDGVVTIGDVVFLSAPGDVLGHEAAVGDTLQAGTPVLTVGSEQRVVVADVYAVDAGGWTAGETVELEWADKTTTTGTVFGVGKDAVSGQVELIVAVAADETGAGDRRQGAETDITLVDATRDDVIAIPVSAIVEADDGSPAVRVPRDHGDDELVPVETGLVANGWIEITSGLPSGEKVRLPG